MKRTLRKNNDKDDAVSKRLDALIRLVAETLHDKNNIKIPKADVVRMLNSAGLTPTEIAKIYGKKQGSSVSNALYKKKSKR